MDLFTVAAKLKLDSGEFEKNLRKMDREGKTFADSLKNTFDKVKNFAVAVGSAFAVKKIADGLWNVANAAAQAGDKIDKQSQALGMSRKAYQEWDYILGQSGASIDSMGVSMKTLNSALLESSDETKAALSKLRLSSTELKHMSQEDAFKKVVEAFQKLPAGAQKSALAVQLFGRNGQELLPLLNSSTESIDELRQKANELGLVMNDEDVNASVAFGDALDTLQRRFTAIKNKIGAKFLPALTDGITKFTGVTLRLQRAFQEQDFASLWSWFKNAFNIKWPTWDDVKDAASKAWDKIKEGVSNLGGLIFGRDENGEVKWPSWEDVKEAAKVAWGKIKDAAVTLGTEFGKLVFGTNEKGEVKWPSWEDVLDGAKAAWNKIKEAALSLGTEFGKIIFGTDEKGEVKWPDPDDIKAKAEEWWKNTAKPAIDSVTNWVLKIFENPTETVENIKKHVYDWWEGSGIGPAISSGLDWTLKLFNVPEEKAEKIKEVIGNWWSGLKETAEKAVTWFLSLPSMPDPNTAGKKLREVISSWWNTVKTKLAGIAEILFGVSGPEDENGSKTKEAIKTWWDNKVVPLLTGAIDFMLGLFDLPSVEDQKQKIIDWWEDVKTAVGNLILDIFPFLRDDGFTTESGQHFTGSSYNVQSQGQSGPQRNRTVTGTASEDQMRGHATGALNIPYDNYPAMLHRNEMVLNATQARQYREGKGNGAGIDFDAMVSRIVAAVTEGIENANIDLDGEKITRNVNRRLAANVRAKRFA